MKISTGDVVEVEFLDHVEDGGEPLQFVVWGRLAWIGREHFEILSWAHSEPTEYDQTYNEKRWSIVRSAVKRIKKLLPKP